MAEDIKSLGELETVASVDEASADTAVIREPKRDDFGRSYATGKRKMLLLEYGLNQVLVRSW